MTTETNLRKDEDIDLNELCMDYFDSIFNGMSGYISYKPGEKEAWIKENVYLTYGEILYGSVSKLIESANLTEKDVFIDLGSGIGKVGLQAFMTSPIKKSLGWEASKARYDDSIKMLARVKKELPDLFRGDRELNYFCENFLDADLSEATVVFTCSTCFGPELMQGIADIVDKYDNIRCLMSLKPVPCKRLTLKDTFPVDCTWDESKCYIYTRE